MYEMNFGMIRDGSDWMDGTIFTPPIIDQPVIDQPIQAGDSSGTIVANTSPYQINQPDPVVVPYETGGIKVPSPIENPPIFSLPSDPIKLPIPEDIRLPERVKSVNTRIRRLKKLNQAANGTGAATTEKDASDLIFGFEPKTLLLIGAAGAVILYMSSQSKGK